MKMARALGIDTIAKGVETKEQMEFLKEIGCAKCQGYYFSRPNSAKTLLELINNNKQFLEVENSVEAEYYNAVDRINLNEFSTLGLYNGKADKNKIMPMAVVEIDDDELSVLRINKMFESFVDENFPDNCGIRKVKIASQENTSGAYTLSALKKCINCDEAIVIDDRTPTGVTTHIMLEKVAYNPVNKKAAILFTVISKDAAGKTLDTLSYNHIVRALSEDYIAMYFVNVENGNYVEYHCDGLNHDVTVEKRGLDFFSDAQNDKEGKTYEADREMFRRLCTKENVLKNISECGQFSITYRANDEFGIRYVNFKAVSDRTDKSYIIIGVNSVDNQIHQQEKFKKINEERIIYSRIAALSGNYFAVYCVALDDNSYTVYKTFEGENFIGKNDNGKDFFVETNELIKKVIHKDDLKEFKRKVNKENILKVISAEGIFSHDYRIFVND